MPGNNICAESSFRWFAIDSDVPSTHKYSTPTQCMYFPSKKKLTYFFPLQLGMGWQFMSNPSSDPFQYNLLRENENQQLSKRKTICVSCLLNSFCKNAPFSKNVVGLFFFYLLLLNTNLSEDGCRLYVSPNAGKSQRRARACLQFGAAVCLQFREGEREKRASVKVIVFFLTVICSTESSLRPVVLWVAIKKEAIVKTEDLYYVRSSKALFTCLHHFVEKFSYEIVM